MVGYPICAEVAGGTDDDAANQAADECSRPGFYAQCRAGHSANFEAGPGRTPTTGLADYFGADRFGIADTNGFLASCREVIGGEGDA